MAAANELKGLRWPVVAVLGDAALTGGMAYEALNNAGQMSAPLIVVLNDNEMSISPNVGGMTKYLNRVRTNAHYNQLKGITEDVLQHLPAGDMLVEIGRRMKDSFKEFVVHSMIWRNWASPISVRLTGTTSRPCWKRSNRRGACWPNITSRSSSTSSPPKGRVSTSPPTR
jgi:hypothetical protein